MNGSQMHFLREILVTDPRGVETPMMEFSYDNASSLHPAFLAVPFAEQEKIRELYFRLGGGRAEGWDSGPTLIIPNRSFWDNLWSISAEEVRVIPNASAVRTPSRPPVEELDRWQTEERE